MGTTASYDSGSPAAPPPDRVEPDLLSARLLTTGAKGEEGGDRRHLVLMIGTVSVLTVIWHLLPTLELVNPLVLPTPVSTVDSLGTLVATGFFWEHLWATVVTVLISFAIGAVIGLAGGAILALNELLRRTLSVYVYAVQALPKVVLAPLFIAWLGFGSGSKIAIAASISFFPVLINTTIGLQSTRDEQVRLLRSLGASTWQLLWKVRVPAALPLIFVGLKNGLLLAFTGTLIAEILVGGGNGLGTLVQLYDRQIRMSLVFAIVAVVAILSFVLIVAFERLDRRIVFWRDAS